jgi:hypothetical protein
MTSLHANRTVAAALAALVMVACSVTALAAEHESYRDLYNSKQPQFPFHHAARAGVEATTNARPAAATAADTAALNAHVALWRSFDVSGAVNGTQPSGINALGEIAGVYADSSTNVHGFLRKAGGEIVTFDAPNVGYPSPFTGTFPTDINNQGDIVGYYTDAAGATHGFVRSARGKFTIIDDPSSTSSPPLTIAQAINDWGLVVGYWNDSNFNNHGFVRRVDGSLTTVEPSGALLSQAYHVNDLGEMGGDWTDAASGTSHGMLLHPDGKLGTFDAPNAVTTFGGLGQALNLEGSFAGTYADANLGAHGYVRYANGKFAEFTAPGGGNSNFNGTWGVSLNLLGTVVGYSFEPDGATTDGYVRFADGTLIIANAPVTGQLSTAAWAINDYNEFTGFWVDAQGNEHGFVAVAVP